LKSIEKMTLTQFLKDVSNNKVLGCLPYNVLWTFINKEEDSLIDKRIIEVDTKGTNNKIRILDKDKLIIKLVANSTKRRKGIRNFIKKCAIDLSYSTVYSYIINNSKSLIKSEIIVLHKQGKTTSRIEILDFEKLKEEIA